MKKASLIIDYYLENRVFDISDKTVNRDNAAHWFFQLREEFSHFGYDLCTYDLNPPEGSEIIVCFDAPRNISKLKDKFKVLILLEPPAVKPENYSLKMLKSFDLVFTWNDSLVDNDRFQKFCFGNKFPELADIERVQSRRRTKFSAMICGNKASDHPHELYSKRREIIDWYAEHHSGCLDLYGFGWASGDKRSSKIKSFASRVLGHHDYSEQAPKIYKGTVASKLETLSDYRFNFCLENQGHTMGYITEKIFDSFFSGSVPVYQGPANVADFIPKNCFVDFTKFSDIQDCHSYLMSLSDEDVTNFQKNAYEFLSSTRSQIFSSTFFATEVVRKVHSKYVGLL